MTYNNLKITNVFFRKKDIHIYLDKYTWLGRSSRSIINYTIVNKKLVSIKLKIQEPGGGMTFFQISFF